jgi:hypothetical protein
MKHADEMQKFSVTDKKGFVLSINDFKISFIYMQIKEIRRILSFYSFQEIHFYKYTFWKGMVQRQYAVAADSKN